MCVLVGTYAARDGGAAGTIECEDRTGNGGCLTCMDAIVQAKRDAACTDDGAPSSAQKLGALEACTCDAARCGSACAPSACNGQRPDDACTACMEEKCAAEQGACFAGGRPPNGP